MMRTFFARFGAVEGLRLIAAGKKAGKSAAQVAAEAMATKEHS